jgi:hypothetical protein
MRQGNRVESSMCLAAPSGGMIGLWNLLRNTDNFA